MRKRLSRRQIERGKTVLLVLLLVLALFLGGEAGIFGTFLNLAAPSEAAAPTGALSSPDGEQSPDSTAAAPFVMAVTWGDGARFGAKYGAAQPLFERFSTLLGEALGSSGEPKEASALQWKTALSGEGVFFDYLYSQPLAVLADCLGTQIGEQSGNYGVRQLCIHAEGGALALYYIDADGGKIYRCDTALRESALGGMEGLSPNGARFAFEDPGEYREISAYTLLLSDAPSLTALRAENPLQGSLRPEEVLNAFGFNSFVATSYPAGNGAVVYVQGGRTLRIDPDGLLSFQGDGEVLRLGDNLSLGALTKAVGDFAARSAGKWAGAAGLRLCGSSADAGAERGEFQFNYVYDNIPIAGGGSAVAVTVTDGAVTQVRMRLRGYALSGGDDLLPLPEKQAVAAVEAEGGGEPVLVYEDAGGSPAELTAQWYRAVPGE